MGGDPPANTGAVRHQAGRPRAGVDYAGHIAVILPLEDTVRQARGLVKGDPSLTQALLQERRQEREQEERRAQGTAAQSRG